jgi:allantoin racemase
MRVTVITPVYTDGLRTDDDLKTLCRPWLTVSGVCLTSGPASIQSRVDEAFAVPGIIAAAKEAQAAGADALVIDCMAAPGLGAVREAVDIPVLGAAETSMGVCAILGARNFGVVSVLDRVKPLFDEMVTRYGYESWYAGCRSVDIPVLELHERMEEVKEQLAKHALELVRDGAGAVILGCTGFMGCAEAIREKLQAQGINVPVVDPTHATVSIAAMMVQQGLSHSKTNFPKWDFKEPYHGYNFLSKPPLRRKIHSKL